MNVPVLAAVRFLSLMEIRIVSIVAIAAISMTGLEVSKMQIIKGAQISIETEARSFTEEKMQKDFEYEVAQMLTKRLVDNGLISEDEAVQISELNKLNFEPFYEEILD